ncbi:MAG: DNA-directed RNA polymerase subunit omega [Acutalibacteraceae bacterium]
MSRVLSVKDMLEGKSNKYPLAVAVAKRAREITDDILVHETIVDEKPVNIAIEEFEAGEYLIVEPD